ncbi:MAG: CehA/McbA family metallohydrolase [Steroidobacteraceae bacterium]
MALLLMLVPAGIARAAVRVVVGPTPILDGDARASGDITVVNEKLAFALAIQSAMPYGVPRGAIVDVAPVKDGRIGRDRAVFADFIPDNWSAWPNTYQHVDILERGPAQVIIRTERDWGKVTIATVYTLQANSDQVQIQTTMRNGAQAPLPGLLSGLTLWPKGGFVLGVPGLAAIQKGSAAAALSDRVVAYDENWAVTLHAPYLDHIAHGSLDMYRLHTLLPGESRKFDGWLQVGGSADLAPVMRAEIERKHLASGVVRGLVSTRDGQAVEQPYIVIEKRNQPYAWVLGSKGAYEMTLPVGDYSLYATARNFSQSPRTSVKVTAGGHETRDFRTLAPPGRVAFTVADARTGKPLDARIVISEGQKPLIEFLGRKTFFTELDRKGSAELPIAPGDYVFTLSWGGGFLAASRQVKLTVAAGETRRVDVMLQPRFDPAARGWYGADLHHHADQAEAVTPPADLARSELAAGLDLLFVSDHDSSVNHVALQRIAAQRGVAFIPGIELSPSWGHFNAYPLLPGRKLAIDTSTATIDEIFKEARRQGATVVQVNHPFIPYGYFASVQAGVAPGGFNPGFDLVEINAVESGDDLKVWHKMWDFWNTGQRYYLAAGTDTHNVWNEESGRVRTFAHVDGKLTAQRFAEALKAGHAYVSYGPLIFPGVMFGQTRKVEPGAPFELGFDLESVAGLRHAELVGGGAVVARKSFPGSPQEAHVDFHLQVARASWFALVAEDRQGRKAYTDPIWIVMAE